VYRQRWSLALDQTAPFRPAHLPLGEVSLPVIGKNTQSNKTQNSPLDRFEPVLMKLANISSFRQPRFRVFNIFRWGSAFSVQTTECIKTRKPRQIAAGGVTR
jgi:hypothetical protein